MNDLKISPLSIIKNPNLRRVDICATVEKAAHYKLYIYRKGSLLLTTEFSLRSGKASAVLWLNLPNEDFEARWVITDLSDNIITEQSFVCKRPRKWNFHIMVSSHTDIGLHNSQYYQRYNSAKMIDKAMELCEQTEGLNPNNRYRYILEGSWALSNYFADRNKKETEKLLKYIQKGKIGVCAGVAGNLTHVLGFEELCRSAYSRKWLAKYGIESKTMSMIDNNGMSWALIQPYAEAGYENIIFAPNQWNPLPSTVWKCDYSVPSYIWNTDAGGGGARIDVSYDSQLPMLFWWEGKFKNKLLVWASTQYEHGGTRFGITPKVTDINVIEEKMAQSLPLLEEKYPYDTWFFANYGDDQAPDITLNNTLEKWNKIYAYPKLKTLGNPDELFSYMREKYGDSIPVLRGDITGGWYQIPASTADLLAEKINIDRSLANAEKIAAISAFYTDYKYPADDFEQAWAALIMNDEHSYGASGYQGRRVYETWMGHRDWLQKAENIAKTEIELSLNALAKSINGNIGDTIVFNTMAKQRTELLNINGKYVLQKLAPFGWSVLASDSPKSLNEEITEFSTPPIIENDFYRIIFAPNGSIAQIYDKELCRIINNGNCNEMLYTADNHKTYTTPQKANFTVLKNPYKITVNISTYEVTSKAALDITVTLPEYEKRIDIENKLSHIRDMFNKNRYYRYLYFGFPFAVENGKRICELGGSEAEYGVDITGQGTDVYMAAHEYCCVDSENEWGVGLVQLDSQLIEFDTIHPDKTDFGNLGGGSAIYSYVANDWLQMHLPSGDELNLRLRYTVTSYKGNHNTVDLATLAERITNPPYIHTITSASDCSLPNNTQLLETSGRLIGLSRNADQKGLVARIYSESIPTFTSAWDYYGELKEGFSTVYLGKDDIKLPTKEKQEVNPLAIGGVETGLITKPKAACGEDDGMLYLLWGKCSSENLSHYALYRGDTAEFIANETTKIAEIKPEEYVVGRYIDKGLKTYTRYYYRVKAVDKDNNSGPLSEVFSAITREMI